MSKGKVVCQRPVPGKNVELWFSEYQKYMDYVLFTSTGNPSMLDGYEDKDQYLSQMVKA